VNFKRVYGAKYNGAVPDALAVLAYDATNMLLTAITNAKSTDPDLVKTALEKIDFNGVSGRITLDAHHDPVKPLTILKVTGGKVAFESVVNP
jgi:branched-chain amino acid transport system substrate-binding protein